MKNLFLFISLWFFLCFSLELRSQGCYLQNVNGNSIEMSGFSLSAKQLNELDSFACLIVDLLPSSLRSNFRIYDFGLYKLNANMEGGYDESWTKALALPNLSQYYLAFGRMDNSKSFKVALKLPTNESFFVCQTNDKIKNLEAFLESIANEKANSYSDYFAPEIAVLSHLNKVFTAWAGCCAGRNPECSACDDLENIKARLKKEGFIETSCKFVSNTGNPNRPGSRNITTEGETNMVVNQNGVDVQLNADLLSQFEKFNEIGISSSYGYIASDNYFCELPLQTQFEAAFSTFNANTSQFKVMYVVVDDPESQNDYLYIKYVGVDILDVKVEEKILSIFDNSTSVNYSGCHGTNRYIPPSKFEGKNGDYDGNRKDIGWLAHSIIQSYYKYEQFASDSVYVEYAIPGGSLLNYTGYADIVNKTTREIWEIKSVKGADTHGVNEVAQYTFAYNQNCKRSNELPYKSGEDLGFIKKEFPWVGKKYMLVHHHIIPGKKDPLPGVISYEIKNYETDKNPPDFIPATSMKVLKEILDRIYKSTKTVELEVEEYLQEHPHAAAVVIAAFAAIAVGAIGAAIVTNGGSILITTKLVRIALIVIPIAWSFTPPAPTGGA